MLFKTKPLPELVIILVLLLKISQLNATIIKGYVLDSKTQEPLLGEVITEKQNNDFNDLSALDGSFAIRNVTSGKHVFVIHYLGYTTQEKEIDVNSETGTVRMDVLLDPEALTLNEVEVIAHSDKGSNEYARNTEKVSDNVLNITSAKTIQLSPDIKK